MLRAALGADRGRRPVGSGGAAVGRGRAGAPLAVRGAAAGPLCALGEEIADGPLKADGAAPAGESR
jgi:hypothetical protein